MHCACRDHAEITSGLGMVLNNDKKELEEEFSRLKDEVHELSQRVIYKPSPSQDQDQLAGLIKYMTEEREKTNRMLAGIMDRMSKLEQRINTSGNQEQSSQNGTVRTEFMLTRTDTTIVEMAQAKSMICADDVKALFNYKGRNAASARLNSLRRQGLLNRHQVGHKVYYTLDADKATKIQIISPPQ
jgi:hypothetical protein